MVLQGVSEKRVMLNFGNNFAKYWQIFETFSLMEEDKIPNKTCIKISTNLKYVNTLLAKCKRSKLCTHYSKILPN